MLQTESVMSEMFIEPNQLLLTQVNLNLAWIIYL